MKKINIGGYLAKYKQERGCLMHFARLANTLLKDEESARDNHVFACNFAKYSPIENCFSLSDSRINRYLSVIFQSLNKLKISVQNASS